MGYRISRLYRLPNEFHATAIRREKIIFRHPRRNDRQRELAYRYNSLSILLYPLTHLPKRERERGRDDEKTRIIGIVTLMLAVSCRIPII